MIDLLDMLNTGSINLDTAYELMDRTIEDVHRGRCDPDWARALGLSTYEARAYAHGASIEDLLQFRYQGWPIRCVYCNVSIDFERDYWWFNRDEREQPCLVHIYCLEGWNMHSQINGR